MATSVTLKPNAIDISGSTSGTTTLQASAVAGTTTLTLPAATDTLVGKATTDTLTNKTLTGAAMNGTLGATTPSTASVTTLTTSSTVTHSGGTANGVAYLDGSKVLTTGSALTFDGTNFVVNNGVIRANNTLGYYTNLTPTGLTNFATSMDFDSVSSYLFKVGGSEKMRLDSAGNLGLGVTPSAWGTSNSTKALQVSTKSAFVGLDSGTGYTVVGNNWYVNSSGVDTYISTGNYATTYTQTAGNHRWYNAPSGTAGNAITFTQAMTLDASGNLVVGSTTALSKLDVAVGASGARRFFANYDDSIITIKGANDSSNPETLRIVADNIRFNTGTTGSGTERARIDSSGNLLVGQTTTGLQAARSFSFQGVGDGSCYVSHSTANASGDSYIQFGYNATKIGSITQSGTTAVAYNTSSDYRLKHDISPMTGALAKVAALKPVTYKWNSDDSEGEGFIAHELAEVCPHAVTGEKDAVDENGNPKYQGIDTSFLVATLTAAIQELKAEFDAYKATHP